MATKLLTTISSKYKRPKVTKCTGMLRCRLRMIPLSGNQERIKGDREGITHTHPIPSVIRLELF